MSMPVGSLFLDTCIFLSQLYGPDVDREYHNTNIVMCGKVTLFSTMTVVTEARRLIRRRRKFYKMIDEVASGVSYSALMTNGASENDIRHVRTIESIIRKIGRKKAVELMRFLSYEIDSVFQQQLDLLNGGLYQGPCQDICMRNDFQKLGLPEIDSQIMTDFVDWGKMRRHDCWMVSLDGHMIKNQKNIVQMLSSHEMGPFTNLDVYHARDVAKYLNDLR